jgi:DNA-binding response OmpR family regulator
MCEIEELLILVVDHEDNLQDVCDQIKEDAGVDRILCASSVEEANDTIGSERVDVIVVNSKIDKGHVLSRNYWKKVVYYNDKRHNSNRIKAYTSGAIHYVEKEQGFKTLDTVLVVAMHRERLANV